MKKHLFSNIVKLLVLVMLVCGAVGCNMGIPTCPESSLQAVTLNAPAQYSILNTLLPALSWHYPDANCQPGNYLIHLSAVGYPSQLWTGNVTGSYNTWTPDTPLLPGREYQWTVWTSNGTNVGQLSTYGLFFVGPMCDASALVQPVLNAPAPNTVTDTLNPSMSWSYPGNCLPESFRIDLATVSDFSTIAESGATGNPSLIWYPSPPFQDCTFYFWRVAAFTGSTLGPYSEPSYFSTNREGLCSPVGTATIRGSLWFDQCPVALDASPVPNPLPEGCVQDSYGVDADGIYEAGEPPMLNMTVNIGPGDCPGAITQSAITDINGHYQFTGLIPGKYCMNVNAASFLGPGGTGHWTVIPSGHEGNTYRSLLVGPGDVLSGQDFAWYQYSGGPTPTPTMVSGANNSGGTPTPTPVAASFSPSINANCRFGPDPVFGVAGVAMKGTSYPIDGRNLLGDWLRLMLTPNRGCWVLTSSGTPSVDVGKLRVLISPPTPTLTLVVDCTSYKDQRTCEAHPQCAWKQAPGTTGVTYHCVAK